MHLGHLNRPFVPLKLDSESWETCPTKFQISLRLRFLVILWVSVVLILIGMKCMLAISRLSVCGDVMLSCHVL